MTTDDFHEGDLVLYTGTHYDPEVVATEHIGRIGRVAARTFLDEVSVIFILPPEEGSNNGLVWRAHADNLKLLARKEELVHE